LNTVYKEKGDSHTFTASPPDYFFWWHIFVAERKTRAVVGVGYFGNIIQVVLKWHHLLDTIQGILWRICVLAAGIWLVKGTRWLGADVWFISELVNGITRRIQTEIWTWSSQRRSACGAELELEMAQGRG
jgi:hypothetical protein